MGLGLPNPAVIEAIYSYIWPSVEPALPDMVMKGLVKG
jgi:hypothetical protein